MLINGQVFSIGAGSKIPYNREEHSPSLSHFLDTSPLVPIRPHAFTSIPPAFIYNNYSTMDIAANIRKFTFYLAEYTDPISVLQKVS
jgi:hypothetical protein